MLRPAPSIVPALDAAVQRAHEAHEAKVHYLGSVPPKPAECDAWTLTKPRRRTFTEEEIAALDALSTVIKAPSIHLYPELHSQFFRGVVELQWELRRRIGAKMAAECRAEERYQSDEDVPGFR